MESEPLKSFPEGYSNGRDGLTSEVVERCNAIVDQRMVVLCCSQVDCILASLEAFHSLEEEQAVS